MLRRLQAAVAEAYAAGYLGKDILGTGYDLDLVVHAGAGRVHLRRGDRAARLARGLPRPAAAAPAVPRGRRPLRLPDRRQQRRVDRQRAVASCAAAPTGSTRWAPRSPRATRSTRSPATCRTPASTRRRSASRCASCSTWPAACARASTLKFWTPGGSSTPLFTAEHLDVPLDFEAVGAAGSMLGTKALQIFDETTSVVRAVLRWTEFYKHESCGKCTPCREGTYWLVQILRADRARPGHRRTTSTSCSTCATTSSAARSARSATAPPARSPRRSSTSARSSSPACTTPAWELFPYRTAAVRPRADPRRRSERLMTVTANAPAGGRELEKRDDLVTVTIDGVEVSRAQGHAGHPRRRAARHRDPALLRPPAARPGRRLPPVPGRGRGPAQAAGLLHHHRHRRHGRAGPSSPRRSPTRRSRA